MTRSPIVWVHTHSSLAHAILAPRGPGSEDRSGRALCGKPPSRVPGQLMWARAVMAYAGYQLPRCRSCEARAQGREVEP